MLTQEFYARMEPMQFSVIKRDGSVEEYDPQKIKSVCAAAGLSISNCDLLENKVSKWLEERDNPEVTTLQIRDRVIVEIQKLDKDAAEAFITYEKIRDKTS